MKIALTGDTHYGRCLFTRGFHTEFLKELAKEDFDVLVHVGDWASTEYQVEAYESIVMFRDYIKKPILTVLGNHDFWDKWNGNKKSPLEIIEDYRRWFDEYEIWYLGNEPYVMDDVIILGFDGWYSNLNPLTNDSKYMIRDVDGKPIHKFLNEKAHKDLEKIINTETEDKTVVGVTHFSFLQDSEADSKFNGNYRYLPWLVDKCSLLLMGHSHRGRNKTIDNCRIIESESDYDNPQYNIIEV